jgi:hypothetical protein
MAMPLASDKRSLLQNERQSLEIAHAIGISVIGQIAAVLNNFRDKHTEHGRDLNQLQD